MIADKRDCLFPIASLTIVCSTIDSNLGIVLADKGLAEGRAGRLPRKGGVGLFNSYAVWGSGITSGIVSVECDRWL